MKYQPTQFFLSYWRQWNRRERILVSTMACFLLWYFFYILIENPLQTALTQARAQVQDNQSTLTWVTYMHARLKAIHPAKHVTTSALLGILHEKLNEHAILHQFPSHLTQHASTQIMLKFEKVPFNLFLDWMWQLNQQYHFEIKQLQTKRSPVSGMVELSCVIEL